MLEHTKHYYIGLPEWRHPDWYIEGKNPKNPLSIYAKHLSSVEGNTTFYALPSRETVKNGVHQFLKSFVSVLNSRKVLHMMQSWLIAQERWVSL